MKPFAVWGLWVLASTLGWAATGALNAYSGQLNSTLGLALVGLGQWTALRRWLRGGGVWVLVTYIAGFAGSMLGGLLLFLLGWSETPGMIGMGWNALLWGVQGAALGAAQAVLLRNHLKGVRWWIAANALGFTLASPLTQLARQGAFGLDGRMLSAALFGLVSSAVSGLALLRILPDDQD
jgi:hypothetical protein